MPYVRRMIEDCYIRNGFEDSRECKEVMPAAYQSHQETELEYGAITEGRIVRFDMYMNLSLEYDYINVELETMRNNQLFRELCSVQGTERIAFGVQPDAAEEN